MMPYPYIRPVSDAAASLLPWSKGPVWVLLEAWSFTVIGKEREWHYTIPAGVCFDGQSIPMIFHGWPLHYGPEGVGMRAGLQHDWLCWLLQGGSPWMREQFPDGLPEHPPAQVIHDHYRLVQLEDGQRPRKAFFTGWAVKLFGPGGYLRWGTIKQSLTGGAQSP
jgi:hypothetical protein